MRKRVLKRRDRERFQYGLTEMIKLTRRYESEVESWWDHLREIMDREKKSSVQEGHSCMQHRSFFQ